jgi:formate dehydrogenase major subunit
MTMQRREFLWSSGTAMGWLFGAGPAAAEAGEAAPPLKIRETQETSTICPYCGVGCGQIVSVRDNRIVNIEGDGDHPVNAGSLCSKGASLLQVAVNERRLTKVRYRAPGSDRWEEKDWAWAVPEIARRIKQTRDATFTATEGGKSVNRTTGIACLGGAALDNEECYLYAKLARALGIVYLEHQARI